VGEDGTELSSAGQLETFLQVPIQNISEKILECWASNFRHEIVRYRKENGQLLNVPVAVVIQEMVENGTISGVMFTNDPVKGDPSFLVINMIEGLGEELVSGQKTPSEIVMKKSLEFIKKPKNMLISEEKCRELAKVGILLEEAFNAPQDIEFVVKDGEIFVVQSRNITNLDLETEWELEHEFDRAVATEDDVISTANVGEVLPYAISPLACDVLLDIYDRTIHTLIYGEDVSQAPVFQHYAPIFKVYQQRLFFNLIDSYMRNWETLSKDRIPEYALAGTKIFTDEMFEIGSRRYPKLSRMDHIRKLKFLAKVLFFESKNYLPMAKKYLDAMDSIKISSSYDSKTTMSALLQQRDFMCQILFLHASASMYSSFTYVFVAMILRGSAEGDLTPEILNDIATIYSRNTYEIVSADVPKSMKKLAKAIYEEDLQDQFKSMENPQTAIDWLLSLGSKSGELARTFMETHGHRGLNELALLGVAWRDDPGHLVKNLRSLLDDNNLMNMPEDSPNSNVDVMDGLRTKVEGTKRLFLKFMISHAHRGVYIREEAKNYLVKATCILRENLLRLSSILKEQKYLPEERMIFLMTWSEIQQLISTRSPRILCRIRRRQKILEKQNEIQYPFINQGTPQPKDLFKFEDFGDDVELFGTAVCEGRVVGHVRVAKTLEEAHLTQPGDILITKYTDIGWSPLFPIIKGLVTEIGGLLSHGAVVAREYGLPCVIAVENATDVFRTGDQVLLDSTKGMIKRIKIE
uniref:Phosphoenolpyruvate synthase n=1 Tax=Acrobeloides nanus TaxID=290746 RepID=A0A914DGC5_9BILA